MATFVLTRAGTTNTAPWPQAKSENITTPVASDLRQTEIQFNDTLSRIASAMGMMATDGAITTSTISTGSTNTISCTASTITISGVPVVAAAITNQALTSAVTIKANLWGLFACERVASGVWINTSVAAGNGVGYASEALAIAGMPTKASGNAVIGYVTVKAGATDWIGGVDGLTLGSGGTKAAATNFYSVFGVADALFWTNSQIANRHGTVLTASNY